MKQKVSLTVCTLKVFRNGNKFLTLKISNPFNFYTILHATEPSKCSYHTTSNDDPQRIMEAIIIACLGAKYSKTTKINFNNNCVSMWTICFKFLSTLRSQIHHVLILFFFLHRKI